MARKSAVRTITKTITPTVKVSVPRAAPLARKTKRRSPRRSVGESTSTSSLLTDAIVGYLVGYLDRQGTAIPTIPILGRAGTLAAGAYFFRKSSPMLRKAVGPLVTIATYELGREGHVSGEGIDVSGSVMGNTAM